MDPSQVSVDKVDGKEGDTYTLTFTPKTEGYIVTKLMINYEEVSLDDHPEILEGTYTGTFESSVVVEASFGSINSYGYSILEEYYDGLVSGDAQLKVRDGTELAANKQGSYYNTTVLAELTTQKGKVDTKVNGFKKEDTIADKIKAIKDVVSEGEKSIKAKYDTAITNAKKAAKEEADKLYGSSRNPLFVEADKKAMKEACVADIDAATTLQGITDVIDSRETLAVVGEYNATEALRDDAFADIAGALSGINETDAAIFGGTNEDGLEALEAAIKPYNVSIEKLPSEIIASYDTQISEAKSFDVYEEDPADDSEESYEKGQTVLGYEGSKKIKAAYIGLKSELRTAILNSYKDEINNSKVLTTQEAKNTLIGLVDGAIGDWLSEKDANSLTSTVIAYTSSAAGGLIKAIEDKLEANTQLYTAAFKNERLSKALTDVYASWKSEVDAIKKNDADYWNLVNVNKYKKGSSDVYSWYVAKTVKSGTTVVSVANPFLSVGNAQSDTGSDLVKDQNSWTGSETEVSIATNSTHTGLSGQTNTVTTWNVETLLGKLVDVNEDGSVTAGTGSSSPSKLNNCEKVADIKTIGAAYSGIFDEVYAYAVETYKNKAYEAVKDVMPGSWSSSTDDGTKNRGYIGTSGQVTTQNVYDSLLEHKTVNGSSVLDESKYSVDKLTSAALTVKVKSANLLVLDNAVASWVADQNDSKILSNGKLSTDTLMWKNTLDLTNSSSTIVKVLKGDLANATAIKTAVSALDDVYEEGVAAYAEQAKAYVDQFYTSLHNAASTMDVATNLENVYKALLKVYGYDGTRNTYGYMGSVPTAFDLTSYDSVATYYECFVWILKGYESNTTWSGQEQLTVPAENITTSSKISDYGKAAFLAALAENGVEIKAYCKPTSDSYADESAARAGLKAYLTIDEE